MHSVKLLSHSRGSHLHSANPSGTQEPGCLGVKSNRVVELGGMRDRAVWLRNW